MSYSFSIHGHEAGSAKAVKAAARAAFARMEKQGASSGSLSGTSPAGESYNISFPEAVESVAVVETPAETEADAS